MDKIVKITQTPVVFIEIVNEDCETIYASAKCTMLHYESGKIKKGEPQYEKYYRKVDESYKDKQGVIGTSTYSPTDFNIIRHYFQEIPTEEQLGIG